MFFQIVGQLDIIDDDITLLMLLEPVDTTYQGGLTRPRRPADNNTLATIYLEIDVLQYVEGSVPFMHSFYPNYDFVGYFHLTGFWLTTHM